MPIEREIAGNRERRRCLCLARAHSECNIVSSELYQPNLACASAFKMASAAEFHRV
jgi:hypothetical protein